MMNEIVAHGATVYWHSLGRIRPVRYTGRMHVISASRRTDIPAFYTPWLLRRLRAGFCHRVNPFNGQVSPVSLRPEDCLALVFWTRDPRPLLPHLPALQADGYRAYAHMTITGYPRPLEPRRPEVHAAIAAFRRLSEILSPEFTIWRYDPILVSEHTSAAYHRQQFASLCHELAGLTRHCYFSFTTLYSKTSRNLRLLAEEDFAFIDPAIDEKIALACELRDIAAEHGITLQACSSPALVDAGMRRGRCVDPALLRGLRPDAPVALKASPTRPGCGCVAAMDIGAYDTCTHGCAYCYATRDHQAAQRHMREHDPEDTILWRPPALRGVDLTTREPAREGQPSLFD